MRTKLIEYDFSRVSERLRFVADDWSGGIRTMARQASMPEKHLRALIRGDKVPTERELKRIGRHPFVNLPWLLTGAGLPRGPRSATPDTTSLKLVSGSKPRCEMLPTATCKNGSSAPPAQAPTMISGVRGRLCDIHNKVFSGDTRRMAERCQIDQERIALILAGKGTDEEVMDVAQEVGAFLERAFPGAASAGMLDWLLEGKGAPPACVRGPLPAPAPAAAPGAVASASASVPLPSAATAAQPLSREQMLVQLLAGPDAAQLQALEQAVAELRTNYNALNNTLDNRVNQAVSVYGSRVVAQHKVVMDLQHEFEELKKTTAVSIADSQKLIGDRLSWIRDHRNAAEDAAKLAGEAAAAAGEKCQEAYAVRDELKPALERFAQLAPAGQAVPSPAVTIDRSLVEAVVRAILRDMLAPLFRQDVVDAVPERQLTARDECAPRTEMPACAESVVVTARTGRELAKRAARPRKTRPPEVRLDPMIYLSTTEWWSHPGPHSRHYRLGWRMGQALRYHRAFLKTRYPASGPGKGRACYPVWAIRAAYDWLIEPDSRPAGMTSFGEYLCSRAPSAMIMPAADASTDALVLDQPEQDLDPMAWFDVPTWYQYRGPHREAYLAYRRDRPDRARASLGLVLGQALSKAAGRGVVERQVVERPGSRGGNFRYRVRDLRLAHQWLSANRGATYGRPRRLADYIERSSGAPATSA